MAMRTDRKNGQRAAIYARVSDKSQDTEEKTSISEQISDMEAHCQRRGLTITARYQEVGRGWSKNRPEFQRMLADAKRGRFDTVVCWKSDRLSHGGMYPAAALMEVVEAYQIDLEAVMDAIDAQGRRKVVRRHRHSHLEARGLQGHLVVWQAPTRRHRARDEEIRPARGRVGRGSLPARGGR